ncbi:hypothetical protein ACOME3_009662 [Neoechinorhynchus agilis]
MPEVYFPPGLPFVVHRQKFDDATTDESHVSAKSQQQPSGTMHQNASVIDGHLDYWVPVGIGILIVILWLGAGFVAALRACFFGSSSLGYIGRVETIPTSRLNPSLIDQPIPFESSGEHREKV